MKLSMIWVAVLAMGGVSSRAQAPAAPGTGLGPSRVYAFDRMTVKKSANGSESRDVLHGVLSTGEAVAIHESVQPAGAKPVALHAIQHSELIMVSEGTMVFEHDGRSEKAGPGDVIYVAFGTTHRARNVGNGPAKYFVVQIGGDVKK
jgi:mannose-6-phosphate isomerase-like protein (cupin superfamily)